MIADTNESGFTYAIPKSIGHYVIDTRLACGSFSVVYKVRHEKTGEFYAMKVISRSQMIENSSVFQLEQELRIMETTSHPNVIKSIEIIYKPDNIYLIMEYCRTDLLTEILHRGTLMQCEVRHFFSQICGGMRYLHSRGIAHHDLKPENILLSPEDVIKITDFGSAFTKKPPKQIFGGTLNYIPPEAIRDIPYDYKKADIWTLGIILYVLATSSFPWPTDLPDTEIVERICKANYLIPYFVDKETKNIIQRCLKLDPNERPTIEELIDLQNPKKTEITEITQKRKGNIQGFISTSALITKPVAATPRAKRSRRIRISNSVNLDI